MRKASRLMVVVCTLMAGCWSQNLLTVQAKGKQRWSAEEVDKLYPRGMCDSSAGLRRVSSRSTASHADSGCRQGSSFIGSEGNSAHQMEL
jgi:hypothetical protein